MRSTHINAASEIDINLAVSMDLSCHALSDESV
jgi:hypothetical protein